MLGLDRVRQEPVSFGNQQISGTPAQNVLSVLVDSCGEQMVPGEPETTEINTYSFLWSFQSQTCSSPSKTDARATIQPLCQNNMAADVCQASPNLPTQPDTKADRLAGYEGEVGRGQGIQHHLHQRDHHKL